MIREILVIILTLVMFFSTTGIFCYNKLIGKPIDGVLKSMIVGLVLLGVMLLIIM